MTGIQRGRSDRGSGTILTATLALCLGFGTLVGVWVIGWSSSHQRATRIADLAALAGADAIASGGDGCAEARRVAERNGGSVSRCTLKGEAPSFVLVVEVKVPLRPRIALPGAPTTVRGEAAAGPG